MEKLTEKDWQLIRFVLLQAWGAKNDTLCNLLCNGYSPLGQKYKECKKEREAISQVYEKIRS